MAAQKFSGDIFNEIAALMEDFHRSRSCTRKVKYGKQSAIKAAIAMTAREGAEFTVYECQFCAGWHIGHRRGDEQDE